MACSFCLASEITEMGSVYDGNVGVARFPDFSPMRKLEIWCKIYFGSPSVAKGLCRRWQLFGIDGFLRALSAASYAHLIASMRIRFGGDGPLLAIGSVGFRAFSGIGQR